MNVQISWLDFQVILPELILVCFALVGLLHGAFFRKSHGIVVPYLMIIGISLGLIVNFSMPADGQTAFAGMVLTDKISQMIVFILLFTTFLTILLSLTYHEYVQLEFTEYFPLLLFSTVGMMLMAKANHFIIFFLGLETFSIALYVLAGFRKFNKFSLEASLKYFLLGAFASGILLYGIALLYGEVGTTALAEVKKYFIEHGSQVPVPMYLALGMILVGFAFKIALVPFHMWTPDVYQGAPVPVTAFMSVGAKAAGFVALIRIFLDAAFLMSMKWTAVMWILAVLTMFLGNIVALVQSNIKRMLAYSSIAHAGYILIGLIAADEKSSVFAIIFYLFVYALSNMAAFGVIDILAGKDEKYMEIDDFSGLGFKRPFLGLVFVVAMLSLAGLPPTAGFMGKLYLFSTAVNNGYIFLVVLGVINSMISAYYYLRPVVAMYMKEPAEGRESQAVLPAAGLALLIALWGMIHLGVFPGFFKALF